MYLGSWVFLVSAGIVSCLYSGEKNSIPEYEMEILSRPDTIVILDPDTGREIKKVIELKDTGWNKQFVE